VALKVPRDEIVMNAALRARFRHEAMAAAGLDHPNIVPVYEALEEGPVCFIASAYCPGITLAAWLRRRRVPVPYSLAAGLVATLAEAVEHAHSRGVLHRDLKLSNVLLEAAAPGSLDDEHAEPIPRVTDFGLAKMLDPAPGEVEAHTTQSGVILGTPSYMAPEQAAGRASSVGPPADIYSLGVILYEILTGRPPFQEESTLETLLLVRTQDPVSPSRLRPRLPRDLETICLKCLRKQPQSRYSSAAALAEDLRRFLAALPIHARPTPARERVVKWVRRHPTLALLTGGGSCAAVTLAVVIGLANIRLERERDRAELRRREAVSNLHLAQDAVDRMLTRVSEESLKEIPQVEPVQRALLEDALEFYRKFARQAHDDPEILLGVGQAYRRLSRAYRGLDDREAERCSSQAVVFHQKLVAAFPTVAVYQKELAESLLAQGKDFSKLGRIAEAEAAVERSVGLLDRLAKVDPNEPAYRLALGDVHNFRAMMLEAADQTRNAETEYRFAIDFLDNVSPRSPGVEDGRTKSAVVRNNLAVLMENEGRLNEAEAIHRHNLEFWDGMAAAAPASGNHRSKVALTLDNLAAVLEKTGRKPEAEQALKRSAALRTGLVKDYPNTPHHFIQLGDELSRLAKLAADRDDLGEARRLQEQSVARMRSALALSPGDSNTRHAVSTGSADLVDMLIRLRLHADAAEIVTQWSALSPESAPERVRAASLLARCVPLASADTALTDKKRAELAQIYAASSIGLLRQAVALGFRDVEALKRDRGFDPLQSRADFQELVAGVASARKP
jgi:tetratricopeptide (TPR) repeat protein